MEAAFHFFGFWFFPNRFFFEKGEKEGGGRGGRRRELGSLGGGMWVRCFFLVFVSLNLQSTLTLHSLPMLCLFDMNGRTDVRILYRRYLISYL